MSYKNPEGLKHIGIIDVTMQSGWTRVYKFVRLDISEDGILIHERELPDGSFESTFYTRKQVMKYGIESTQGWKESSTLETGTNGEDDRSTGKNPEKESAINYPRKVEAEQGFSGVSIPPYQDTNNRGRKKKDTRPLESFLLGTR